MFSLGQILNVSLSIGEQIIEPEVDLSSFLERQKLSDAGPLLPPPDETDDDVDTSLSHIGTRPQISGASRKGKVKQIDWDEGLEELSRDKASAEATWGTLTLLPSVSLP